MKKFKGLHNILLVDDDKFINLFHTKVVERSGLCVSVKAINNVTDAIAYLAENKPAEVRPSIIFLDINMPGLTGWDFMTMYAQLEDRYKVNVIVVMLTTSLNPDDYKRAQLDGNIANFLHKPLRSETLLSLAEQHFESEQSEKG